MAKQPLDVANGKDMRNHWKVVLFKNGEGVLEHTALFYPTQERAIEVADYLNSHLTGMLRSVETYIVKPHNPVTYKSVRDSYRR